jgi:alpha-galactosidase
VATEPPAWVDKNGKPIQWHGGLQYDLDTGNAKRILADLATHYPGAKSHEIAGFVWFQGHKDQGEPHASRYEQNLVALINALRKDFSAPKAPFVLATGCGNPGTEKGGLTVALAQLAMNDAKKYPDFAGNVRCVDVRALFPKAEESPSKQGYHYYWNGAAYMDIGMSLGQAMTEMMK